MPNWCENTVQLFHPVEQVSEELQNELTKRSPLEDGDDFLCQLFNYLRPRPADQEDNWYQWNIDNWGTKWDADIFSWQRMDKNTISLYFNTAWSPPIALYKHLEENGWMVTALYHELGNGFVGRFVGGVDQVFEYDLSDESSIENVPPELAEWANLPEALAQYQEDQEQS